VLAGPDAVDRHSSHRAEGHFRYIHLSSAKRPIVRSDTCQSYATANASFLPERILS
jgi:hypothetical protein